MGGVEAAVLDGVGVVITNEGVGLSETEETVIVVGGENLDALWSRVARTRSRAAALIWRNYTTVISIAEEVWAV